MHPTLLIKSVLLLILLNGAAVSSAQAASLAYALSCMSNPGEDLGPRLGMLIEERAGGALFTIRNCLGVPSSITDIYSDDAQPALFSIIANHSDSGVGVSVDSQAAPANLPGSNAIGFHADVSGDSDTQSIAANGQFKVGLHVQGIGLAGTASSYINQQSAVPIPAAAWLFSSALFGFVVFANRRKV